MSTSSKPPTASTMPERKQTAGRVVSRVAILKNEQQETALSRQRSRNTINDSPSKTMLRSVPPVHELTSYNIGYKPKSNIIRYQRTAPAPTNMSYLPSAQEGLLQNRKLLAKVVGFDSSLFEQSTKSNRSSRLSNNNPTTEEDMLSPRYSNAFASARSPRGVRSTISNELEMSQLEILKGHGLPATPRLLRGGDSKRYGVRRQISANNQLELSPDFNGESAARKSAIHFNTPAGDVSNLQTPADEETPASPTKPESKNPTQSRESHHASQLVTPFGDEAFEVTKTVLTNSLAVRERNRDAPWVYCYKIKRDRLKLSQLLTSKSPTDPAVDELLPAF